MQSPQSLLGAFDLIIFLLKPFFAFVSLSTASNHGVNGSVCKKWHEASLSFLLNPPWTISLTLLYITAGGTPLLNFEGKHCHVLELNQSDPSPATNIFSLFLSWYHSIIFLLYSQYPIPNCLKIISVQLWIIYTCIH